MKVESINTHSSTNTIKFFKMIILAFFAVALFAPVIAYISLNLNTVDFALIWFFGICFAGLMTIPFYVRIINQSVTTENHVLQQNNPIESEQDSSQQKYDYDELASVYSSC